MRILLAAADRDLLECYRKILEADFGETVTAFDGTQVLLFVSTERFEVVILDRDLPSVDGETILKRISGKGIPVIVLENEESAGDAGERGSGSVITLSYPFTPEELGETIRRALLPAAPAKQNDQGEEG